MFSARSKSDEKIVNQVLKGKKEVFGLLVRRYMSMVRAVAYAHTGNMADADDVVQETFIRAFRNLDSLRERRKFAAWLQTIARNATNSLLKVRQRETDVTARFAKEEIEVRPHVERRELHDSVRRQIMRLDKGPREILLLRYYAGKSFRETAAFLDITTNAAQKRLKRAQDILSKRMLRELEKGQVIEEHEDKETSRLMGIIGGLPTDWAGIREASDLASAGLTEAKVFAARAIIVTLAAIACVIGGITALRQADKYEDALRDENTAMLEDVSSVQRETSAPLTIETKFEPASETPESDGIPGAMEGTDSKPTKPEPVSSGTLVVTEGPRIMFLGSVSGIVIDGEGNPLADLIVRPVPAATAKSSKESAKGSGKRKRAKTNSSGEFKVQDLKAGDYYLIVVLPKNPGRGYPTGSTRKQISLLPGEHKDGIDFAVGGGLAVWGQVKDVHGEPIPGAHVSSYRPGDSASMINSGVDQDGFYMHEGFPDGDYTIILKLYAEGYEHKCTNVVPGRQCDIVLERNPVIGGRVVRADTGEPVEEFKVTAWTTPENIEDESKLFGLPFRDDFQNDEGRFELSTRSFGDVTVAVRGKDGGVGREYLPGVKVGDVIRDVVVHLEQSATVKGIVTDGRGNPISDAQVFIGIPPPVVSIVKGGAYGPEAIQTYTSEDGSFEIVSILPETYLISAYAPGYAPGWTEVDLHQNTVIAEIELNRGGALTGMVSLGGEPLETDEYSLVVDYTEDSMSERNGKPGPEGGYIVTGLKPGMKRVRCLPRIPGFYETGTDHSLDARVNIVEGETATLDLDFTSGCDAMIHGNISYDGSPVRITQIQASHIRSDGVRAVFRALAGKDGSYRLEDLPEGRLECRITGYVVDGPYFEREFILATRSEKDTELNIDLVR
ncbi:sigma-70 family RNA polymerase sigma factor [Candidatus Hydrogenedentota bacterium]